MLHVSVKIYHFEKRIQCAHAIGMHRRRMSDNNKLNYEDAEKARKAWRVLRNLRDPDNTPEKMLDAVKEVLNSRDVVSGLMDLMIKITHLVRRQEEEAQEESESEEEEDEDEPEEEEVRRLLRWICTDRRFNHLMNLACFRYARDDEARKARGERHRSPTIPYGVEDCATIRFKIENYRVGLTGRGSFDGGNGQRYATKTIKFLCEFNPTDEELDEAAEYYRRNSE